MAYAGDVTANIQTADAAAKVKTWEEEQGPFSRRQGKNEIQKPSRA